MNTLSNVTNHATDVAKKRPGRPPRNTTNVDSLAQTSGLSDLSLSLDNLGNTTDSDESTHMHRPSMDDRTIQKSEDSPRMKRIPLHKQTRERLIGMERPGYKRHLFNDNGDRVRQAELAGWNKCFFDKNGQVVGDRDNKNPSIMGSLVRIPVDRTGTRFAVLMEIPLEIYNADQLDKANERKNFMKEMMTPPKEQGIYKKAFKRTDSDHLES